ncbi:MAG: hypothetical protein O7B77_08660 [Actinobacteria bacterium]|nr:hypothetical protein [Actinomycetota bacterium]
MFGPVVVTAQRRKIAGGGGSTVADGDRVVEVTVGRRHPTSGEDATPEARLDMSFQGGDGSPGGDPGVDHLVVVVDHRPPPFRAFLFGGDRRAMSAITGPNPASSPGFSVRPVRVSRSTRISTIARFGPLETWLPWVTVVESG